MNHRKSRCVPALLIVLLIGALSGCEKTVRRTYQAYVATDGKGPAFLSDMLRTRPDVVVLYRTGHDGVVCFDSFHSKDLHDRLSAKNGKAVTVEYDTSTEFGRVYGYNVRSVDGIMLNDGHHVFSSDFAGDAGVFRPGPGTASGNDCW